MQQAWQIKHFDIFGQGTNAPSISGSSDQAINCKCYFRISCLTNSKLFSGSGTLTVNLKGNDAGWQRTRYQIMTLISKAYDCGN